MQTVQASPVVLDVLIKWVVEGTLEDEKIQSLVNATEVRASNTAG